MTSSLIKICNISSAIFGHFMINQILQLFSLNRMNQLKCDINKVVVGDQSRG